MKRPYPPAEILDTEDATFVPAPEVTLWVAETFINSKADLHNSDHENLENAFLAFLWANVENTRKGKRVLGTAQLGQPMGSDAWKKGQREHQLREWFGRIPDFLITLDAEYCLNAEHAEWCALLEHEMYHCRQKLDAFGEPKFNEAGQPMWTIQGHDVEEFVGVVRRYGMEATRTRRLVEAAQRGPSIAQADINGACGTCLRAVA